MALILVYCILAKANSVEGRIIGGTNANFGEVNYMASLRNLENEHFCGGWIHSSRWIVSAASCTIDSTIENTYAVIGSLYRTRGGDNVALGLVINHPLYNPISHENDISLLMTAVEMISEVAHPIRLNPYPMLGGEYAVISGWGETTANMVRDRLGGY